MTGWHGCRAACVAALLMLVGNQAHAAKCGSNSGGFESWKKAFAQEAQAKGAGDQAIAALMATNYSTGTIRADRGQHSFKLSLDQFMAKRGASTIAAQGRKMKGANAALFNALEKKYGVPAGPLITIWGMETAFGKFMGNQPTVSAVATLAYDCRRPEYFTDQLYAALELVDRGVMTSGTKGAMHGEVGQTQFLPKNILLYGVDGDGNGVVNLNVKTDALASTANFLKGHGWVRGGGYQPGEPNFAAIEGWNAAKVYQQTIAIVGQRIDGN